MKQIVLHLKTTHDVNGNPRRIYLPLDPLMRDGKHYPYTHVIEEGYAGRSALKGYVDPDLDLELVEIYIPVGEYKSWIAWAKERGTYIP